MPFAFSLLIVLPFGIQFSAITLARLFSVFLEGMFFTVLNASMVLSFIVFWKSKRPL
jgi:hypothetical protein